MTQITLNNIFLVEKMLQKCPCNTFPTNVGQNKFSVFDSGIWLRSHQIKFLVDNILEKSVSKVGSDP